MSLDSDTFIATWNALAKFVHRTAVDKGWWDKERNDGEMLALIHSEVSEALEALRHGNPPDDKIPEFSGAEAELADVVIRIMDMAHAHGWNVAGAIVAKAAMNAGRPRMHGGKLLNELEDRMDEKIGWVTSGEFPHDGVPVLVEVANLDADGVLTNTEVIGGFLDGELWRAWDAIPLQHVVSWAPMPKGTRGAR